MLPRPSTRRRSPQRNHRHTPIRRPRQYPARTGQANRLRPPYTCSPEVNCGHRYVPDPKSTRATSRADLHGLKTDLRRLIPLILLITRGEHTTRRASIGASLDSSPAQATPGFHCTADDVERFIPARARSPLATRNMRDSRPGGHAEVWLPYTLLHLLKRLWPHDRCRALHQWPSRCARRYGRRSQAQPPTRLDPLP